MSDKPKCPYLGGKPCIESKCAAWATDVVEENGVTKAKSACLEFFWKPLYLRGIANRADGTQRAVESMRNEVVRRMDDPLAGLQELPRPQLGFTKEAG